MDILSLHERALDKAARLVDNVPPGQMSLPTPCAEWDVRALLAHLVGGNLRWAAMARGEPLQHGPARGSGPSADLLGNDPASSYRRSATALQEAWQDPTLLDQTFDLPIGALPGQAAMRLRLVETVVHAWDLAQATGQRPAFDPAAVREAWQFTVTTLPACRPADSPFAAPVPVADDAPEIDRLAAYLGRTPCLSASDTRCP